MLSDSSKGRRRAASGPVIDWLASVVISQSGPSAARTAVRRAASPATAGLPILILDPRKPASRRATASSTRAAGSISSQPPSVEYIGTRVLAPPASRCSGSPARFPRKSQSAMSMAARASDMIGPTAVAWLVNRRSRQIASIASASRPIRAGRRVWRRRARVDGPPSPMV